MSKKKTTKKTHLSPGAQLAQDQAKAERARLKSTRTAALLNATLPAPRRQRKHPPKGESSTLADVHTKVEREYLELLRDVTPPREMAVAWGEAMYFYLKRKYPERAKHLKPPVTVVVAGTESDGAGGSDAG